MAALSDIRSELSSEPVSPIQSTLRRRLCIRLTVISPEAGTLINDCPETTKGRGYGLQRALSRDYLGALTGRTMAIRDNHNTQHFLSQIEDHVTLCQRLSPSWTSPATPWFAS